MPRWKTWERSEIDRLREGLSQNKAESLYRKSVKTRKLFVAHFPFASKRKTGVFSTASQEICEKAKKFAILKNG